MGDFNNIPTEIMAVLLAMVTALVRILGDGEENKPTRIILESLLCGALSMAVSYGIRAAGLDLNWSIFAGGMIGYLGSATARSIALKLIELKISKKDIR